MSPLAGRGISIFVEGEGEPIKIEGTIEWNERDEELGLSSITFRLPDTRIGTLSIFHVTEDEFEEYMRTRE